MSKQILNKAIPQDQRVVKAFRISTYHNLLLEQMPGKEFPGILIRLFLDDYFNGKLPEIKRKFEETVAKTQKERLAVLAEQARKNANNKVTT